MFESIFGSKEHNKQIKEVLDTLVKAAQCEELTERARFALANQQLRPSRQHPVIYYYDGKNWVCTYCYTIENYPPEIPEEMNMGSAPAGIGKTPEEAALAFDEMWSGGTSVK